MSRWTHAICMDCWREKYPDPNQVPAHMINPDTETCCFCGKETSAGIYIRWDGRELHCKGGCQI